MITEKGRQEVRGWITGRVPQDWFTDLVEVAVDREEITVIGRIAEPELAPGATETEREAACEGRVTEFRERTRTARVEVAREANLRFRRQVSWGVECGGKRTLFTHVSAPVMTRLRQPERLVLDTLIAGGVARSRSEALAWCVRLVEHNAEGWLADLRASLAQVERVRAQGPDAGLTSAHSAGAVEQAPEEARTTMLPAPSEAAPSEAAPAREAAAEPTAARTTASPREQESSSRAPVQAPPSAAEPGASSEAPTEHLDFRKSGER